MKLYLIILLMLCSFVSCAFFNMSKGTVIKHSIKLEGKNTNIRDLIDIDGYYSATGYEKNHDGLMFFEDGTYMNIYFKEGAITDSIQKNMTKWLYKWTDKNGQIQCAVDEGTYRIEGDTIIVRNIFISYALLRRWESAESKFKVIDRTTINSSYNDYYSGERVNRKYMFVSCDSLPTADMPLKEHKWIWRNEQDWKDYMQRIEQKKIKKK